MSWKEPLLHFFVLGLVVFGLYSVLEPKPKTTVDPFLLEVTSADIEWFKTMWTKQMGREPTVEELRGQVNRLIREQVLSREAKAMGLDRDDTVIRRRLMQKMDFLFKDVSEIDEPTDDDLLTYLNNNADTYQVPEQTTFVHIYFNVDKRGEAAALEKARQVVEQLNTSDKALSDVMTLGDPFLLSSHYTNAALPDIERTFGPDFTAEIHKHVADRWFGPVRSAYGLHVVNILERRDARLPDLDDLREKLRMDWMANKHRELGLKAYQALRKRYQVLLEGMPYSLDIQS